MKSIYWNLKEQKPSEDFPIYLWMKDGDIIMGLYRNNGGLDVWLTSDFHSLLSDEIQYWAYQVMP